MSDTMTPREIESELDRYIIGQSAAKRSVAVALRNRWRRRQVASPMREEITPKNILMIGPTGVGKTEIARRLAKLVRAPFVKVEATKYTEVGYVGRDVESIVRDLVDTSIKIVREEHLVRVRVRAEEAAEDRLLDILIPHPVKPSGPVSAETGKPGSDSRDKMRRKLRMGEMDERQVEIEVRGNAQMPVMQVLGNQGDEGMGIKDMLDGLMNVQPKRRRMSIRDALTYLQQEEADRLLDMDRIREEAVERAENDGIVFLDEMDKITHREGKDADVSREGVQRDLLPLVEGTTVSTKSGQVNTDHMLFIASGAFHLAKPSDLIPELQGRFPIRVNLDALGEDDFRRILTEPENALTRQYVALMATEGITTEFTEDGIGEMAKLAVRLNEKTENIGARRLHTMLERVLEEASFDAPDRHDKQLTVDAAYVLQRLGEVAKDEDLSRYIL